MTENTYYKPRLLIGDKEVFGSMSGNISFSGNSQVNSCTCKITDPAFQNHRLYGKELKVYLNYGSDDGVPIFRGFIKEVKTACLWKKKSSTFEPDFCPVRLDSDPWIVQPTEHYEELSIEEIIKRN